VTPDPSDAGSIDAPAPVPDSGTQPPPGNGNPPPSGDDGGCTIAAHSLQPSLPSLISPFLLAIGAGALLVDRRRRKRR
jgi:hypothetical protein